MQQRNFILFLALIVILTGITLLSKPQYSEWESYKIFNILKQQTSGGGNTRNVGDNGGSTQGGDDSVVFPIATQQDLNFRKASTYNPEYSALSLSQFNYKDVPTSKDLSDYCGFCYFYALSLQLQWWGRYLQEIYRQNSLYEAVQTVQDNYKSKISCDGGYAQKVFNDFERDLGINFLNQNQITLQETSIKLNSLKDFFSSSKEIKQPYTFLMCLDSLARIKDQQNSQTYICKDEMWQNNTKATLESIYNDMDGSLNGCTYKHVAVLESVRQGQNGYDFRFYHQWKETSSSSFGSMITIRVRDLEKYPCRMGYGKALGFKLLKQSTTGSLVDPLKPHYDCQKLYGPKWRCFKVLVNTVTQERSCDVNCCFEQGA